MTVAELGSLHRRYVDSSERFRAAWAFHQFVGSLHKILLDGEPPRYPVDFQQVYSDLKEVSHHLNASSVGLVQEKLGVIDRQLGMLMEALLAEDSRIDPASLRHFFLRVRNTTEKILTQLIKFYIYTHDGSGWPAARIDKLDFLLTRLSDEAPGADAGRVSGHQDTGREVLKGLWQVLGESTPPEPVVEEQMRRIARIRTEVAQVKDLDELVHREIVPRYRGIKHAMGSLFLFPDLLRAIVDANLKLRDRIQALYQDEEKRLAQDYQQIFELGRDVGVGSELDQELVEFRQDIERFEERRQRDELSLDDLAQIRRRMRSLMPRLGPGVSRAAGRTDAHPATLAAEPREKPATGGAGDLLAAHYERLVAALEGTNPREDPRVVVLRPEIFALRLEPREVEAYRRLTTGDGGRPEAERFLLESAALRVRLNDEVAEIRAILDDTVTTGEAPVYRSAFETTRLAAHFLRRFDPYIEEATTDGDVAEARELQLLRMRLMRDYSGLWLLAYKPFRGDSGPV